jgi:glycosyltransferase involved in cell wall biosynthesis
MNYVRWMSREAVGRGYDVWLATSVDCLEHPACRSLLAECGGRLRTVALPEEPAGEARGALGQAAKQLRCWRLFDKCYGRLAQDERPDYVFVPYLDHCIYATALLGSPFRGAPWGGLLITPSFHLSKGGFGAPRSRLQWVKEKAFFRLLRDGSLRAAFTFDEALIQHVRRDRAGLVKRLRFLPEPAELHGPHSRGSARRALGVPADAKVVLVYGVLDATKGIDALLSGTEDHRFPGEVSIILAGRQDAEVRAMLASPQARSLREAGRLFEIDKYMHGEDEHAVFRAADVVWIGYRRQYISSGVLIQAAMAGLPNVACDEGLIGWLTERHGLGLTVRVDDARAAAEAISRLVRDPRLATELGENGVRFSQAHKVGRFSRTFGDELLLNFPGEDGPPFGKRATRSS